MRAKELPSIDLTRHVAELDLDGVTGRDDQLLPGLTAERVRDLAAVLLAAEAVGIAQWCVDTAADYAKVRVQFGRPIGQFQGVKHRCADMLARAELARAAVWDAARAARDPATVTAWRSRPRPRSRSTPRSSTARTACRRSAASASRGSTTRTSTCAAITLHQIAGTPDDWRVRAAREVQGGARRRLAVDLGPEAEAHRAEVRALLDDVKDLSPREQRERFAHDGYLTPGWPTPWGRDAKALELLVIEEEFRARRCRAPTSVSARGRCRR